MLTVVDNIPDVCKGHPWSFGLYAVLPFLRRHALYTPDPHKARIHVLPERNPWNHSECDGLYLHRWLENNYEPFKNESNLIVHMNFCDLMTDCQYVTHDFSNYPPEFSPASPTRRYTYLTWNGRSDGADSGNTHKCTGCVQKVKDVVMPTAQNACGPLCGDATLETLRRNAVWSADAPDNLIESIRYVETWPQRRYNVYWAGQVKLDLQRPTADPRDDISGRGEFYRLFHSHNDSYVRNSYDWKNNVAVDDNMPPILEMMRNSTFCFSPLGRVGGDHDRYLPALLTGCVPIILKSVVVAGQVQHITQPYEDIIEWNKIAVMIHADEIHKLPHILKHANIISKRAHVFKVWRKLLYSSHYGNHLGESSVDDALQNLVDVLQLRAGT